MITILLFTLIGLCAAQVCPPPEVLSPCRCSDTGRDNYITCIGIRDDFNLKEVFDNASALVNDGVVFDWLSIALTNLTSIEEGTFENLKFKQVWIDYYQNINYISPLAFNASRGTTAFLSLLTNPEEEQMDIFDFVTSFKYLQVLAFHDSGISSLPDRVFENMTLLRDVRLYNNNISRIGSRAFANTPSLEFLELYGNSLDSEGIAEDAFEGSIGFDRVTLECNKIEYLDQKRFQPLLDRVKDVTVGNVAYFCPISEYDRLHCDERADWICEGEVKYRGKLRGFRCKDGQGYADIWEYCEGKNKTLHV